MERHAAREAMPGLLRFVDPPQELDPGSRFRAPEDTVTAYRVADQLVQKVFKRQPIALSFRGLEICTQSYLHALLFEPLRLAWARQTPIYILDVGPGVRSGLELLESYALGG